jgi:2-C-methyl-D-erythritol 4-phosphate cytidylyltransferase
VKLTAGGAERQDSVAAGVQEADPAADVVLVHDAARPFVRRPSIEACLDVAVRTGAAAVALPARDTVKVVGSGEEISATLDRRTIWLAQTPQAFHTPLLRRALAQAQHDGYVGTDDAELVERLGVPVHVVHGEATNLKITTPEDLHWAEWYYRESLARIRGSTAPPRSLTPPGPQGPPKKQS